MLFERWTVTELPIKQLFPILLLLAAGHPKKSNHRFTVPQFSVGGWFQILKLPRVHLLLNSFFKSNYYSRDTQEHYYYRDIQAHYCFADGGPRNSIRVVPRKELWAQFEDEWWLKTPGTPSFVIPTILFQQQTEERYIYTYICIVCRLLNIAIHLPYKL